MVESTAPSRPPSSSLRPRPRGGPVSEQAVLPDVGILLGTPRTAVPRPLRGEEGRGEETPSRRRSRGVRRGELGSERELGPGMGVVVRRGSGRWETTEGGGEPTRRGEPRPRWLWGFETESARAGAQRRCGGARKDGHPPAPRAAALPRSPLPLPAPRGRGLSTFRSIFYSTLPTPPAPNSVGGAAAAAVQGQEGRVGGTAPRDRTPSEGTPSKRGGRRRRTELPIHSFLSFCSC